MVPRVPINLGQDASGSRVSGIGSGRSSWLRSRSGSTYAVGLQLGIWVLVSNVSVESVRCRVEYLALSDECFVFSVGGLGFSV